jgi:hypothetical protein
MLQVRREKTLLTIDLERTFLNQKVRNETNSIRMIKATSMKKRPLLVPE